jgi:hypothetical protein
MATTLRVQFFYDILKPTIDRFKQALQFQATLQKSATAQAAPAT